MIDSEKLILQGFLVKLRAVADEMYNVLSDREDSFLMTDFALSYRRLTYLIADIQMRMDRLK